MLGHTKGDHSKHRVYTNFEELTLENTIEGKRFMTRFLTLLFENQFLFHKGITGLVSII